MHTQRDLPTHYLFNEYSVIKFKRRENECVIFRTGMEKFSMSEEAKLLNIFHHDERHFLTMS